jgi:hypothetical protein
LVNLPTYKHNFQITKFTIKDISTPKSNSLQNRIPISVYQFSRYTIVDPRQQCGAYITFYVLNSASMVLNSQGSLYKASIDLEMQLYHSNCQNMNSGSRRRDHVVQEEESFLFPVVSSIPQKSIQ